ncbi:hypothetical protein M9H77_31551 [Catharanthus roseus]|uniref:Uncharacterized protein n=1 Tax=Catharanthus roseus TaxID=4058 RepID=A0ACC0A1A3_CATRO|nr:hypothetical protein M9H77_31551 [Catharanthus roseus]
MGDSYWNRQGPRYPSASGTLKRPRLDYELATSRMSSGHDLFNYTPAEDLGGSQMLKETQVLGSAYDRYLQSSKVSLSPGEGSTSYSRGSLRAVGGAIPALQIRDPLATGRAGLAGPELATTGRRMTLTGQFEADEMIRSHEPLPLPRDASSTLYVEGLPSDSTKREVARIL